MLERVCEMDPKKAFRIHHVIWRLADDFGFFEIHQNFAKNVVTGFIRMGGEVVGVVANNPACLGGALDCDASDKAARFIRFLNAFNIPLLTLVDIGGYLPGVQQEHGGIIRHGAKLLYAYSEASIPKVTLVCAKRTAARILPWAPSICAGISTLRSPVRKLPLWARAARWKFCIRAI